MPPERRDAALLWDMLRAAQAVVAFVDGKSLADYEESNLLQSAVERKLEIIGEAARGISKPFRDAHPEIPWKGIIGQRNVLAHAYGAILPGRIWVLCSAHVPDLIAKLELLTPEPPEGAAGLEAPGP